MRPVAWRTGIRSRPDAAAEHGADRWCHRDERHQRPQRPRRPADGHHDDHHQRGGQQGDVEDAGASVAETDRERALAGHRVGRDVAQVVDHQQCAGKRADAGRDE